MAALTGEMVRGILVLALFAGTVGSFIVWTVVKSEDPALMIFKWVLTAGVLCAMVYYVLPMFARGGLEAALVGLPAGGACAVVMVIVWRRSLAALIAQPFADLYDGGSTPPDPHPAYSVAMAREKQGHYLEAIEAIRQQLERFPTDVEGHLLMAQIQAEHLHDLPAAEATIYSFCSQPSHAPQNIVFALYSMADWCLSIGRDREAARRHLEKVGQLLPDSEFALGAAQRIAHLGTAEMVLSPDERKKFVVPEGVQRVGLYQGPAPAKAPEKEPGQQAAEYVRHLEEHPLDTEARECLAVLYADHYARLDLATAELEQLIAIPNQPGRLVVHWLNLLADLQIRCGSDYETVRQTLQRIIDRGPTFAPAEIARNRLALLKLEFKGQEQKMGVKLGAYEQNIGLKQGRPRGPAAAG